MLCWWEVIHTVAWTDIYPERYISPPGALYTSRHRYVAPPEVVCSAPTDMYHPGPIHNTGRYVAGFALHMPTDRYVPARSAQTRYIGGATFLTDVTGSAD